MELDKIHVQLKFSQRLRQLRKEHFLTQVKLGQKLNYGKTAVSNYENARNFPYIGDIKKMALYFNVTLDYLLGFSDSKINSVNISRQEQILILNFRQLTSNEQSKVAGFIEFLVFKTKEISQSCRKI